jgi:hypothetical protein
LAGIGGILAKIRTDTSRTQTSPLKLILSIPKLLLLPPPHIPIFPHHPHTTFLPSFGISSFTRNMILLCILVSKFFELIKEQGKYRITVYSNVGIEMVQTAMQCK